VSAAPDPGTMAKDIHLELIVPSDTTYLSKVRQAVMDVVGKGMFSAVKANLIALAVDEAVANIMEHAYASDRGAGRKDIEIVLNASARRFEVLIRDKGVSFDPRGVPDVDVKEHVKAGRKGGLGIFLMRRIMDEINYSFKQGVHNELQMIKYVDEENGKNKSKPAQ
jgi:anti-sigma regulatory factor (Ser/Thr protein kinase)